MWLILQVGWSEVKRVVIRKQLKQNCPHLELRGEALTGEPCSPAPCMPKSSSSAKGINMKTTVPPHDIHRLLHAEQADPSFSAYKGPDCRAPRSTLRLATQ